MPFKSKSQLKYLFANKPEMAKEWVKKTKNIKDLPERVKESMDKMLDPFTKIAKELFNPIKNPPVPSRVIQQDMIQASKDEKMKGMTPVEYRNELTSRRTGIVQKNKESIKAS